MSEAVQYANEIRKQLDWGVNPQNGTPMRWCWGAHGWLCGDKTIPLMDEKGQPILRPCRAWLRFSVTGLKFQGLVYVILTGGDDYTILLVKNKRKKNKEHSEMMGRATFDTYTEIQQEVEGIYCDQLAETIHYMIEANR